LKSLRLKEAKKKRATEREKKGKEKKGLNIRKSKLSLKLGQLGLKLGDALVGGIKLGLELSRRLGSLEGNSLGLLLLAGLVLGVHRGLDGLLVLTGQPLGGLESRDASVGVGEQVLLEHIGLTRHLEADRDDGILHQTQADSNLALRSVAGALGQEAQTLLGLVVTELRQAVHVGVRVSDLVVGDVGTTLGADVQARGIGVVEGNHDTGLLVHLDLDQRLVHLLGVPDTVHTLGRLAEADNGDLVLVAHPDGLGRLGAGEAISLENALGLTRVEDADLQVLRGGDDLAAVLAVVEGEDSLAEVGVLQHLSLLRDVPETQSVVSRSRTQDVVGGGVELQQGNFLLVTLHGGNRSGDVLGHAILRDLGDLDVAVLTTGGEQGVDERVEVEVEDIGLVNLQLGLVDGQAARLVQTLNDNGSTTALGSEGKELGVGSDVVTLTIALGTQLSEALVDLGSVTVNVTERRGTNESSRHGRLGIPKPKKRLGVMNAVTGSKSS